MRGQAAIEFLVLTGFMVLVFTTFFLVVQERASIQEERARYNQIIEVAEVIETEVSLANAVHTGYNRTFELPRRIGEREYQVVLWPQTEDPSEVIIRTSENEYVLFLQVNLSLGSQISPGFNTITKIEEGNITVSAVDSQSELCVGYDIGEVCSPPDGGIINQFCECDCREGQYACGGSCITPGDACDSPLGASYTQSCACVCPEETPDVCDDTCVDTQNDNAHCGSCGNVCDVDETCVGGVCVVCTEEDSTNNVYRTSGNGVNWNNVTGADDRVVYSTNPTLCCDAATQCVWTNESTTCKPVGHWNGARWICDDTGLGAEMFVCASNNDGQIFRSPQGTDFCCSLDTVGGRVGEYLFARTSDLTNKEESLAVPGSCTDGSDNDCDGVADSQDPGCWALSVEIESVCEGSFSESDDLFASAIVSGLTGDIQIEYDWRIDGTSLTRANYNFDVDDSAGAGQITDYSSNARTASEQNGIVYQLQTGSAVSSGGYLFDGVDDQISLGSAFSQGYQDFSIELWVKAVETITEDGTNNNNVLQEARCSTAGTNGAQEYVLYPPILSASAQCPRTTQARQRVGVGISLGTDGIAVIEHGGGYMPALLVHETNVGTGWRHVVVVYESRTPSLYIGGTLVHQGLESYHDPIPGHILGGVASQYGFFDGRVNSFRIWDRALSPSQILHLSRPANAEERDKLSAEETTAGDTVQVCITANNNTHEIATVCSSSQAIGSGSSSCTVCPPPAPVNLAANAITHNSATLTWTPGGESDYQLIRVGESQTAVEKGCPGMTGCVVAEQISVTQSSYDLSSLQSGTTYYARIVNFAATCGAGEQSQEQLISFTTCGGCFIGGQCYAQGVENPSNQCQICSGTNPTGWSNKPNYDSCDADSQYCTDDYCYGGTCYVGGDPCSSGVCDEDTDLCVQCVQDTDCTDPDRPYCMNQRCVECNDNNQWSAECNALYGTDKEYCRVSSIGGSPFYSCAECISTAHCSQPENTCYYDSWNGRWTWTDYSACGVSCSNGYCNPSPGGCQVPTTCAMGQSCDPATGCSTRT